MLEIKLADNFWRPDRKARRPHLNARIWYVDILIVTIEPSGPHNEVLVRLSKQIKEESGRHISKDDPLQIKTQKFVESTNNIKTNLMTHKTMQKLTSFNHS